MQYFLQKKIIRNKRILTDFDDIIEINILNNFFFLHINFNFRDI